MKIKSVLSQAHLLVSQAAGEGAIVIDATVGNGKDTLFLGKLVGPRGKVYGFDIQQQALENTRITLTEKLNSNAHIELYQQSHAEMLKVIPNEHYGKIAAIMFNLGYLPGGDHALITRADTTLTALEAGLRLLKAGGVITIVVYSGHLGGQEEAEQVEDWVCKLPQRSYQVLRYEFINQHNHPPYLIAISKRGEKE